VRTVDESARPRGFCRWRQASKGARIRGAAGPAVLMRLRDPVVWSFRLTPEIDLRTEDVRRIGP